MKDCMCNHLDWGIMFKLIKGRTNPNDDYLFSFKYKIQTALCITKEIIENVLKERALYKITSLRVHYVYAGMYLVEVSYNAHKEV